MRGRPGAGAEPRDHCPRTLVKPLAPQFCSKIALDLHDFMTLLGGPWGHGSVGSLNSVLKLPWISIDPMTGGATHGDPQFCSKIAPDLN
jgi:hypothetical protein